MDKIPEVPTTLPEPPAPAAAPASDLAAVVNDKVSKLHITKPKLNFSFKIPKKIIVIVGVLVFVILVLAVVLSLIGRGGGGLLPTSIASPTPSSTPQVEVPSEYADDEDVKRINERMIELEKNLNEKSFRDDTLRVPSLDWEVSF